MTKTATRSKKARSSGNPKLLDKMLADRLRESLNLSVPWYLMASHAYYDLDRPFLSDAAFDQLAKIMLMAWDRIEHPHKEWITKDDLEAGSLLRRDFPTITKDTTRRLLNEYQ